MDLPAVTLARQYNVFKDRVVDSAMKGNIDDATFALFLVAILCQWGELRGYTLEELAEWATKAMKTCPLVRQPN